MVQNSNLFEKKSLIIRRKKQQFDYRRVSTNKKLIKWYKCREISIFFFHLILSKKHFIRFRAIFFFIYIFDNKIKKLVILNEKNNFKTNDTIKKNTCLLYCYVIENTIVLFIRILAE